MKKSLLESLYSKNLFFIAFFVAIILFFVVSITLRYDYQKKELYSSIDLTLKNSAYAGYYALDKDFYIQANTKDSIEHTTDQKNIQKLSLVADSLGIEYLYILKKQDNNVYFISSSATKDDIKNDQVTHYFDHYDEATPLLKSVFDQKNILYEESTDKWGTFRTVLIPIQLDNGNKIVLGADIKIDVLLEKLHDLQIRNYIFISIFVTIIIFALIGFRRLNQNEYQKISDAEKLLQQEIEEKTEALKIFNEELQERVDHEVQINLAQKIQLQENIKLAQLGSMFGNIVHQWKQPLNYISLVATGLQLKSQMQKNKSDFTNYVDNEMEHITDAVHSLDETLNTFKNFLKEQKEFAYINLQETIRGSLIISSSMMKNGGVTLKNSYEKVSLISINSIKSELQEVIINIVNNAKDVLLENNIDDPWIDIDLIENGDTIIISIEDNGGGIPLEIMDKIFDNYFTTKGDKGTGLGLSMSKMIVEQSLGGKLYVYNTHNGAKFFIELPYRFHS